MRVPMAGGEVCGRQPALNCEGLSGVQGLRQRWGTLVLRLRPLEPPGHLPSMLADSDWLQVGRGLVSAMAQGTDRQEEAKQDGP